MSPDEKEAVERLLDKDATSAKRKSALKWFADYLEEGYILNLPAPRELIAALETFSKRTKVEAALKTKAKNLIKKYGL